jgi:hypothetical protein
VFDGTDSLIEAVAASFQYDRQNRELTISLHLRWSPGTGPSIGSVSRGLIPHIWRACVPRQPLRGGSSRCADAVASTSSRPRMHATPRQPNQQCDTRHGRGHRG